MKKDNNSYVLYLLVKELSIPVTLSSIIEDMDIHPEKHSLLGMSEILSNRKIPNAAYSLTFQELLKAGISSPFIAFTITNESNFALVHEINEEYVVVSNEKWKKRRFSISEFNKIYDNAVLLAEKDELSGETNYSQNLKRERLEQIRLPAVLISSVAILLLFLLSRSSAFTFNFRVVLIGLVKLMGVITSILLLVESIDSENEFVQRLCSSSKKINCSAILSSKASKISDELSWSEVGFFYFTGTWIVTLFNNATPLLQILAIFNIFCLPYTFYSIYYQWKKAKQWCLFCCFVQLLLWIEFILFFSYLKSPITLLAPKYYIDLLLCMAIPILAWVMIKPLLIKSQQLGSLKQQLRNFKYNTVVFRKLLEEEAKYELLKSDNSIIIGNENADNIITIVSNPFCPHCSIAHQHLDELMDLREDLKLQVIFEQSSNRDIVSHFLSLYVQDDKSIIKKALNDWHSQKTSDYSSLARRYPTATGADKSNFFEHQDRWCSIAEIRSTPSIFFNGRRLPKNYKPEDLKYLF